MDNIPVFENPELLLEMKALKTTTPAHAETFNAMFQILLNNDAFLNENKASSDHTHYIDLDEIDAAFLSVFTHVSLGEATATAMSAEEIEQALSEEWDGTSSEDPNALSATEINEAIANASK